MDRPFGLCFDLQSSLRICSFLAFFHLNTIYLDKTSQNPYLYMHEGYL